MTLEFDAPMISDATAAGLLADHWAKNDADSFWSKLRDIVELTIPTNRGIAFTPSGTFKPLLLLALSDIIELDDTQFDIKVKLNGKSWSGVKFKIFSIARRKLGLIVKGVSL